MNFFVARRAMFNWRNLVMMMVQLNSESRSRTTTVILPSVVAFWMANTAALAANIGWRGVIMYGRLRF